MRKSVDLSLATRFINHGPVVLVSSVLGGRVNITPVAWHMPIQKTPPLIVLEIDEGHFIYECILKTGDFVVNIPSSEMVKEVVKCGSVSGRDVDKLELSGFTSVSSKTVSSPGLDESIGLLECILIKDEYLLKQYNMVLGEVKYAEAEEALFSDHWMFTGGKTTLHHLGKNRFCSPGDKSEPLS